MKFGTRQRWAVLVTLLTAALSAAAWVREGENTGDADAVDAPVRRARPASTASAGKEPVRTERTIERIHLEKLQAHSAADPADDAFATRNWRKPVARPQAAASAVVVIAPPPSAPPLPFVYVGKMFSEEISAVFLTQGDRNLIVHEGDVIDAIYRVNKVSDAGLTFIHLPTGIQQNLSIGEPQ